MSDQFTSGSIKEKIAEKIAGSGESVAKTVIENLASVEINNRVQLVTNAYQLKERLEKESLKMRPDQKSFGADGVELPATWSAKAFEAKKKFDEKFTNLSNALDKALNTAAAEDFKKLKEQYDKANKADSGQSNN